tara:strand:+ start:1876 stop:3267 length:1392 start_codon:yes stop_codon:yes gene_type:complete
MLVECGGLKLITDPWLVGSCYWRSWWNFPEPPSSLISEVEADFIYLSHLHWDHFHGPSLKKYFNRETQIIVPKVVTNRMVDDLNYLGFANVIELPHNHKTKLGKNLSIHSFQFGEGVDSAIMISGENVNLFNVNDCKLFGLTLKNILSNYPKIDFVFRSHSSATAIPYCIEGYEDNFFDYRTKKDYAEDFFNFSLSCKSRYAVPFASNHCFLHRDTVKFNSTAADPSFVYGEFNAAKTSLSISSKTEIKIMPPGSSWDSSSGFDIIEFDYEKKNDYINNRLVKYKKKLEKQYKIEENSHPDFYAFQQYFKSFFKSLPFFSKQLFSKNIVFHIICSEADRFWKLDFKSNLVKQLDISDQNSIIIKVPSLIVNDCTKIKMFSVWTASKRLEILLPKKDDIKIISLFFRLLDLYELDRLPILKNFNSRSILNSMLRWREILTFFKLFFLHFVFRKKFRVQDLYIIK